MTRNEIRTAALATFDAYFVTETHEGFILPALTILDSGDRWTYSRPIEGQYDPHTDQWGDTIEGDIDAMADLISLLRRAHREHNA